MKRLLVLLLFLPSLAWAGDFTFSWAAAVVPPAHEPVIGDKVARIMLEAEPGVVYDKFRCSVKFRSWGVNTWKSPAERGHGWEKYENSDWSVEEWRTSATVRAEAGPNKLFGFAEYYFPFNRGDWNGNGFESNYSLFVGIGGRYR